MTFQDVLGAAQRPTLSAGSIAALRTLTIVFLRVIHTGPIREFPGCVCVLQLERISSILRIVVFGLPLLSFGHSAGFGSGDSVSYGATLSPLAIEMLPIAALTPGRMFGNERRSFSSSTGRAPIFLNSIRLK